MFEAFRRSISVFVIALMTIFASSALAGPPTGPRQVNCLDDNLQEEIDESETNDVLEVTGDCDGSVVIPIDGLTLRALAGATLTGDGANPAISITGNRVTVEDWALIDGDTADGIVVGASGSAQIQDISLVEGNDGIVVTNAASAEIDNVLDIDATDDGIFATLNGVAIITNTNSSNNGGDGLVIGGGGAVHLAGGNTVNSNGRYGIFTSGGQLQISGSNTVDGHGVDVWCTAFSRIIPRQKLTSTTKNFIDAPPGGCAVVIGTSPF
jgi:hypothetical protein